MGLGKLLQERAKDTQLRLEGLCIGGPQCVAVACVLCRGDPTAVKRGEADSFSRHDGCKEKTADDIQIV